MFIFDQKHDLVWVYCRFIVPWRGKANKRIVKRKYLNQFNGIS